MLKGSRGVLSQCSSSTASATRRRARAPPDSCPWPGGARPTGSWYWRRARVCVFGRRDPAQPKICSFFPHKDGRARCRGCRVDTSARDAVAGTPELSRQVAAFLVGDIASIRA